MIQQYIESQQYYWLRSNREHPHPFDIFEWLDSSFNLNKDYRKQNPVLISRGSV